MKSNPSWMAKTTQTKGFSFSFEKENGMRTGQAKLPKGNRNKGSDGMKILSNKSAGKCQPQGVGGISSPNSISISISIPWSLVPRHKLSAQWPRAKAKGNASTVPRTLSKVYFNFDVVRRRRKEITANSLATQRQSQRQRQSQSQLKCFGPATQPQRSNSNSKPKPIPIRIPIPIPPTILKPIPKVVCIPKPKPIGSWKSSWSQTLWACCACYSGDSMEGRLSC